MKYLGILFMLIGCIVCFPLKAQIDGDNLFSQDQIIHIELDFSQESFWDSLVLNYATETYMKADLSLTDVGNDY